MEYGGFDDRKDFRVLAKGWDESIAGQLDVA